MNYVKPNKGKSIEERRAEVIADNQELWGTQTGSGVSTGASSGASTGTNTGTDDDYRYYHGAYNGKMNKMPDINAKKPAERPEESWFRDEDFLPRDDDYKDEAWEKAFIEAFLEESGVKTPRSKKADALNGVPAAKPSVEDFFNHYGKPSFSFDDIIEDYRKSNAALLGGNKFPSQEMILQKENDLPGYRPGSTPGGYLNPAADPRGIAEKYYILEDYYGKPGKNAFENAMKGMFNRFRSAPGEAIEDLAFLIKDFAPWYKPAQNVVEKNTAGTIGNTATGQFGLAKDETGYFGDRLIDAADAGSAMLGHAMIFGPSHLALSQSVGGGLDEYRYQRESGADKSEALVRGAGTGLVSYGIERLGGLGADNSALPKINLKDTLSMIRTVTKTALQEGGEEAAEYTANSLMNSLADAIYKGKISVDWDVEDAFNSAVSGALVGGGLSAVPTVNGRDIDIVDEMNKIVSEKTDVDTKIENAQKLKDSLGWRKKAEKEVDKLLWYLGKQDYRGVDYVTRNAIERPIIGVNHFNKFGLPNDIVQVGKNPKRIERNYLDSNGKWLKQISNSDHGKPKHHPYGEKGEHTHDIHWKGDEFEKLMRNISDEEKRENLDILWMLK